MRQYSETLEKVTAITKETSTDVGKIRLQLIQIVKEAIKVGQKIQNSTDAMFMTLINLFENLKTSIVNTIYYFLRPQG